MSSKNRPYVGKDGNRYSDYFERQGADTRYEQHQKLIQEQQETNKLMREQQERIKNGGLTNGEIISQGLAELAIAYIMSKDYQSEISINIKTTIIIMYPTALLICFALMMYDEYKKFIPVVIVGVIIIHIYLQFCINLMEKNYKKNNTKRTKKKNNS